jgi:iron(III) transport system permease protein
MAIGWIFLASPGAGFINGWLQPVFSIFGLRARIDIANWWGLIFVYTLNAVPYTYLILSSALRNLDPSLEEASRTSGASNWRTFREVSIPAIKPAVLAAALLVVIHGFTSFSVPLIIATRARIDVLSVRMMRLVTAEIPPRLDQATTLSVFLVIAVASIWFYQRKLLRSGNFSTIGGKSARSSRVILGRWRYLAWGFITVYVLCAVLLPLFAITVVALQPFWQSSIDLGSLSLDNFRMTLIDTPLTRDAFVNSITFGLVGAAIVIAATTIITVQAGKTSGRLSGLLDGITKLPAALSHLALAIGFLVAFSTAPFYLAGTAAMLILVYVVMCLPEASIMITAAASQVGRELSEASRTSGATDQRTFFSVTVPLMLPGIMSGFAIVFVLIAGEVTASSLLAKPGQPVIGYALRDTWESGSFGGLSALATAFTLLNLIVVTAALSLGRLRKVK